MRNKKRSVKGSIVPSNFFSGLSKIFTMSKRKTLDDFVIAEPEKSTPREITKIEAHVTTVTAEEI
nr:unnamed protein product [Callosobruchus analis]